MEAKEYANLLLDFDPKKEAHRKAFEQITYRFPYFQSAYAHYLKALKAQEQYNFNMILRKTAVLSPSREVLHAWLEERTTPKKQKKELQKPLPTTQSINPKKQTKKKKLKEEKKGTLPQKTTTKKPSKKTPLHQESMQMSFNEWVVYSAKGKVKKQATPFDREEKNILIDRFLSNQPKIPPVTQDQPKVDLSANNVFNTEELMTETLAKVYVQQKKYKKALYAYKILSLKYPEKNSFFADQIKAIKERQKTIKP